MRTKESLLFLAAISLALFFVPADWVWTALAMSAVGYVVFGLIVMNEDEFFREGAREAGGEFAVWTGARTQLYEEAEDADAQLAQLNSIEVPELAQRFPYESTYHHTFERVNGLWDFELECCFGEGRFHTRSTGHTPREAFALGRYVLRQQIREWHKKRFSEGEVPFLQGQLGESPRILIVEDDVDLALSMEVALRKLGCRTEIATQHEDLHRRILGGPFDYILLDWQLNDGVSADTVIARVVRLIDAFSDLRRKFMDSKLRIITHSVLDREEVHIPAEGSKYFTHIDHWHKPLPFHEMLARASGLMTMH